MQLMKNQQQNNKKYKNLYNLIFIIKMIEVLEFIEEYHKKYHLIKIYLDIEVEDQV